MSHSSDQIAAATQDARALLARLAGDLLILAARPIVWLIHR